MFKITVLLLITFFSCQKTNDGKEEIINKEKSIELAISQLRELDISKIYDLYYVIETRDSLLYVINVNKDNRVDFMYFFDQVGCKPIEDYEYIIYLNRSSNNPQKDNCVDVNFNVPGFFGGYPIKELNGVIFSKVHKNKLIEYVLVKKGNIFKEISEDPDLIIELEIEEVR